MEWISAIISWFLPDFAKKIGEVKADNHHREIIKLLEAQLRNNETKQCIVVHDNVKETAVLTYSCTYKLSLTKDCSQTQEESFKNIKDLDLYLTNSTRFRIRDFT